MRLVPTRPHSGYHAEVQRNRWFIVALWGLGCGGATTGGSLEGSQTDADAGAQRGGAGGVLATGGDGSEASAGGGDGGEPGPGGTGARPGGAGGTPSSGGAAQGGASTCKVAPCPDGTFFDANTCACVSCVEDADCAVLDDCCACQAFSRAAPAESCLADCPITACSWRFGGSVRARCESGTCQLDTGGSCNSDFCPPLLGAIACCTAPNGPCGILLGSGCGVLDRGTDAGSSSMDPCALAIDPGPCRASFPAYAYDPDRGCIEFTYGGCEGNENRFDTLDACEMACP